VRHQLFTCSGQLHLASVALQEGHAGLALQLGELLADGRGRDPQGARRSGYRAAVGHLSEDAEPLNAEHKHSLRELVERVTSASRISG
jgi:hypothetical protein